MDYRTLRGLAVALLSLTLTPSWLYSTKAQGGTSATAMQFDTVAARAAGYTDAEIVAFIDSVGTQKISAARAAGYTDAEILAYADSVRLKARNGRRSLSDIADETLGKADGTSSDVSTAERVGVWLWLIPLAGFLVLIWSAVSASRLKAWVGELHWGQLLILCFVLFFSGYLPIGAGLLLADAFSGIGTGQGWVLGFIPLGPIAALLALWWWFGARRKSRS
jgi:hypothetical protein